VNSTDRVPASALVLDDDREAHGLRVVDARHAGEVFERARLVDVDLVRCDLSGCDFSESLWQRVTLVDCRASAIELPQANLRHVTFAACKLDDANFRLAKFERVRFDGSVLVGAELIGARLDGLRGMASLAGATIGVDQLFGLAPALAQALGLHVSSDQ